MISAFIMLLSGQQRFERLGICESILRESSTKKRRGTMRQIVSGAYESSCDGSFRHASGTQRTQEPLPNRRDRCKAACRTRLRARDIDSRRGRHHGEKGDVREWFLSRGCRRRGDRADSPEGKAHQPIADDESINGQHSQPAIDVHSARAPYGQDRDRNERRETRGDDRASRRFVSRVRGPQRAVRQSVVRHLQQHTGSRRDARQAPREQG